MNASQGQKHEYNKQTWNKFLATISWQELTKVKDLLLKIQPKKDLLLNMGFNFFFSFKILLQVKKMLLVVGKLHESSTHQKFYHPNSKTFWTEENF